MLRAWRNQRSGARLRAFGGTHDEGNLKPARRSCKAGRAQRSAPGSSHRPRGRGAPSPRGAMHKRRPAPSIREK